MLYVLPISSNKLVRGILQGILAATKSSPSIFLYFPQPASLYCSKCLYHRQQSTICIDVKSNSLINNLYSITAYFSIIVPAMYYQLLLIVIFDIMAFVRHVQKRLVYGLYPQWVGTLCKSIYNLLLIVAVKAPMPVTLQ